MSAQSLDRSGSFQAYGILAPQNADRFVQAYVEEMAKVRNEGFSAAEVDAAKSGYLQARSQGRANDDELVGTLVNRRFAGRTLVTFDEAYEKAVQALTPALINSAVKKHLDPAKTIMVRAGDFAKNPPVKATP